MTSQRQTRIYTGDKRFRDSAARAVARAERNRPEIENVEMHFEQAECVDIIPESHYIEHDGRGDGFLHIFKKVIGEEDVSVAFDIPLERDQMFRDMYPNHQSILQRIEDLTAGLYAKYDEKIRQAKLSHITTLLKGLFYSIAQKRIAQRLDVLEDLKQSQQRTEFRRFIAGVDGVQQKRLALLHHAVGLHETSDFDAYVGEGVTQLIHRTFQAADSFVDDNRAGLVDPIASGMITIENGHYDSEPSERIKCEV